MFTTLPKTSLIFTGSLNLLILTGNFSQFNMYEISEKKLKAIFAPVVSALRTPMIYTHSAVDDDDYIDDNDSIPRHWHLFVIRFQWQFTQIHHMFRVVYNVCITTNRPNTKTRYNNKYSHTFLGLMTHTVFFSLKAITTKNHFVFFLFFI